ncbi:GNAT family N-acetyltransferase [Vallicoccus soli]|uniref:GNAT family N-acetyltransferase n=1 Tax=Vallicoccus soli TaxID=2339232 RepID=UPI0014025F1A|nr:GNAT family N-acetyltransferase [Vallicoccus soli]
MEPVELRGDGLVLRCWSPGDAPAVHAACQDPLVQRWTTVPVPYTAEHARAFVEQAPARWAVGLPAFGVYDATSGAVLGAHGVVGAPEPDVYELGLWVAAPERGRGVARAATRLVAAFAFARLGAVRLEWQAEVGNWPSRRVAEACGFVVEGTLRGRLAGRGDHPGRADAWMAGLLPEDLR